MKEFLSLQAASMASDSSGTVPGPLRPAIRVFPFPRALSLCTSCPPSQRTFPTGAAAHPSCVSLDAPSLKRPLCSPLSGTPYRITCLAVFITPQPLITLIMFLVCLFIVCLSPRVCQLLAGGDFIRLVQDCSPRTNPRCLSTPTPWGWAIGPLGLP